jgi:hypothetical protein
LRSVPATAFLRFVFTVLQNAVEFSLPSSDTDPEKPRLIHQYQRPKERIEKNVSDQREIDRRRRGPSLRSKTVTLAKRNLGVVKWLGTTPAV